MFFAVVVPTKKGVKRYVNMNTPNGIPVLTFDKSEACLWNDDVTAKKWAENYFVDCDYWIIDEITININAIYN